MTFLCCFKRFFSFIRRALSIKPLQLEALQLLCEASIMIGDLDSVVELVQRAEKMYDNIQYTQKISNQTIASMYYKLALLVSRVSSKVLFLPSIMH